MAAVMALGLLEESILPGIFFLRQAIPVGGGHVVQAPEHWEMVPVMVVNQHLVFTEGTLLSSWTGSCSVTYWERRMWGGFEVV